MAKIRGETYIEQGTAEKIKKGYITIDIAKDISHAMSVLNRKKLGWLRFTGTVRKLPGDYQYPTYIYYMNRNNRIIFTVEGDDRYIQDIVNVKTKKSILEGNVEQIEADIEKEVQDSAKVLASEKAVAALPSYQPQFDVKEAVRILHEEPVYNPNDTEVAIAYTDSLNILIKQRSMNEAMKTLEELRELTLQHPENTDIAVQYAKGLAAFSATQVSEEGIKTLSEIFTLFGNYPDNDEIAKKAKESLIKYSFILPYYYNDLVKLDPIKYNIHFTDYKLLIENDKYATGLSNISNELKAFCRQIQKDRISSFISMEELPLQLENNKFVILCKMLEEKILVMNLSDSLRFSNDFMKKDRKNTYMVSLKNLQQQIMNNAFYVLPENSFVIQEIKTKEEE